MSGLPLADMHPDYSVVAHAEGVIAHALSSSSGVIAIYLDGKGPSRVALRLPAGDYRGQWLNVVTGEATPVTSLKSSGAETILDAPLFENGIALRLQRALY